MRELCFWMLAFYVCCNSFLKTEAALNEKRCNISIVIRNSPKTVFVSPKATKKKSWKDFLNCTILDGDFEISMTNANKNDDYPIFEHLQQITGNLLVFETKGLTNLGHIFPNLKIIGGQSLISNNALIIFHNKNLRYIGLKDLKLIRNGGVRITDNPKLCFSKSINWDDIIDENRGTVMIDRNRNRNGYDSMFSENGTESCQDLYGCKINGTEKCQRVDGIQSCWDPTNCQKYCPYHKLANNKIGPGCSASGERCHSSCLGGCEIPNDPTSCYACQKFELNGRCVDRCPPGTFQYLDNRCLTKSECQNLYPVKSVLKMNKTSWKAFNGKCYYDCPDGYQEDPTNPHVCIKCDGYCPRKCIAGREITSIKFAMIYEKCNIIEGNLIVEIEDVGKNGMEKLTKAFGNISEITGFLQIRFSPTFTSLHMFKSLEIIHGEELVSDRYALSVAEMKNLQQLFKQNITIKNGTVNFQNNPKLCYSKIMNFVNGTGLQYDIIDSDIPKYSNGENGICDATLLDIVQADYQQNRFIEIKFKKFNTTNLNHTELLGYTVFYKKVDKIDYDMIPGDNDSENPWNTRLVYLREWDPSAGEYKFGYITYLDPNTIYAYYIQTNVIQHPEAKNAISKIRFFKTPFKTPSAPILTKAEALDPNKIILEWDPPVKGNGIITHYTVMWNAKSIGFNGQDQCGGSHSNLKSSSSLKLGISENNEKKEKCHKCPVIDKKVTSSLNQQAHDDDFEDAVLNNAFGLPSSSGESIEYFYFDQYSIREEKSPKADEIIFPEIFNENITFGRANISTTRVVLTGLHHLTEYYIQIIACQDITVPENHCSKQAASRIIRTKPIPENDVIDAKTIKVFPYIINGTEQEDSRLITWKIPTDPNGAILGFRFKIWKENEEISLERCISKADYDKINGTFFPKLKNGIYSFKIQTISSAGASDAIVKKNLFEIHASRWFFICDKIFYLLSFILVFVVCLFMICGLYNRYIEKKAIKYAQKVISSKGQTAPLL